MLNFSRLIGFALLLAGLSTPIQARQLPPISINEVLASNQGVNADPEFGNFSDWFELYNDGNVALDLSGYFLTDDFSEPDKWRIPDGITIPLKGFRLFWADGKDQGVHTGFKLAMEGEQLGLFSPTGVLVDTLTFGPQTTDISWGRAPDGGRAFYFFADPTPEKKNDTPFYNELTPPTTFSHPGGFYETELTLALTATNPGGQIHYTLDGSPPTPESPAYQGALILSATTVVRAAVFKDDALPGPIVTKTYFIGESSVLPVFSLATHPDNFFDDEIGIYVEGTNGITGLCRNYPVNWNRDWERPIHIEFFEPDGTLGFSMDAGVKIFGGCARIYPQKSLGLYARRQYGAAKFDYQIFQDLPLGSFNNLILRTSSQDWWRTMFRDGMIQTVVKGRMEVDNQAYRPAIVFLNGEYWGIHNIREKLNGHYIEAHFGIDNNQVEILDSEKVPLKGKSAHYDILLNFIETADMALPESYAFIQEMIDVDQYLDYLIAEIYTANADWPSNNLKLWRPLTPEGKWRWMFFDADMGFGGNGKGQYDSDLLAQATATNGPAWPNPPWSTYMLRRMLENETFRNTFIQRFAAHINTTFETGHVNRVIDSLKTEIAPEIPRHKARWEKSISYEDTWDELVDIMYEFARSRPRFVRPHFYSKFGISGSARLNLNSNNPEAGHLEAAGVAMPAGPFGAVFFKEVPIKVKAIPGEGFVFKQWEGLSVSETDSVYVTLSQEAFLTAVFEPEGASTANEGDPTVLPTSLDQNYPNPVGRSTMIGFQLERTGKVMLKVYDLLGREVETLVDKSLPGGKHRIVMEATGLTSGVYFYQLRVGDFTATHQMLVVRQ